MCVVRLFSLIISSVFDSVVFLFSSRVMLVRVVVLVGRLCVCSYSVG